MQPTTTGKKFPKLPNIIETDPKDKMRELEPSQAVPLFPNTDIPLACLFIHLEHSYTIPQFLQDFPSVSQELVQEVLETATRIFKHPTFVKNWESYCEMDK